MNKKNYFFVLGGEDNEMVEIKMVLDEQGIPYFQPQLMWGKIYVSPRQLPEAALNKKLVFVECFPNYETVHDLNYTIQAVIDHHNERAAEPASLLQVLKLLRLKPSLRQQLVASIDSVFLSETIKKFPQYKQEIWDIWESGYKKSFPSDHDYELFKAHCNLLFDSSVEKQSGRLVVITNAPNSYTYLAALADMWGKHIALIVGSEESNKLKPCFYGGDAIIVKQLAQEKLEKAYWGKKYFGCRAIPRDFLKLIKGYEE